MSKQHPRHWLGLAVFALWTSGFLCPSQSRADQKIDLLRQEARYLESKGQWDKACAVYWEILKNDRSLTDVKERCHLCLRHMHLERRHRDDNFRRTLANLKSSAALKAFEDVLAYLQKSYVDKNKTSFAELIRYGIDELRFALLDEVFVQNYLPKATPAQIHDFQTRLKQWPGLNKVTNSDEARNLLRLLVEDAQQKLSLNRGGPVAVVFEFICGAINALDEYTFFLTPDEVKAEQALLKPDPMMKGMPLSMPTVEAFPVDGHGVGYVRIFDFQESTVQELRSAILQLQSDGMKALILDLRGNLGGLFPVAIDVARSFLTQGTIAFTQSRLPQLNETHKANNPDAWTFPLVVLVDGHTASAAEVLAGALKENLRAIVVGQTTFGKSSIQHLEPVEIKIATGEKILAGLRITLARFYSPANQALSGRGVVPHVLVDRDEEDGWLSAAHTEALKRLMMDR